ncbi:hypothetical protein AVJ23_09135 [Pseudoponticoccus marisrubri]|uniref:DUF998 domain-containing protein n=1 Tax=Pseudoponticoccus marisrubri TaxID=1685382 RepID=A0A0W7WKQ9_9RHOB|nr:hypothetical protein AVJ23_09135 [Pseudoponticoccus marisrubri]
MHERGGLLLACGALGCVGTLAPIVAMALALTTAEHDIIADTISDLGRGPHHEIMDTGFYMAACGLIGLAIGAAHAHLGRWAWSLGLFCLAALALIVTLLGIWDAFHDTLDGEKSMTVHTRLTFALGPLYLAGPLLMAQGAANMNGLYRRLFILSAGLWTVFAVAFKLAPDGYDGLLEKIAVTATLLWTLPLGWMLLRRGQARLPHPAPETGGD